jgi:F-type H+-transporting ATPase subunit epsilon
MERTFQLDIVSPAKLVFSDRTYLVEVPGREGDFGVMAGHMPFVSALRAGVITAQLGPHGKKEFFITSGYAEVNGESCTILTEHVQDLSEIDSKEAEEALANARRLLARAETELDRTRAQKLVDDATTLVEAL